MEFKRLHRKTRRRESLAKELEVSVTQLGPGDMATGQPSVNQAKKLIQAHRACS